MLKLREVLVEILEEMGFIIFEKNDEDINIGDYITDSIQFISFIINIEQLLGTELTEDFLQFDILSSVNGLSNKLSAFCEQNGVDPQQIKITAGCFQDHNDLMERKDWE